MKAVFGDDELGKAATSMLKSATTKGTDQDYSWNLKSFFELYDTPVLDPQKVSPIDIAR